ncbi:valine--tRNA ligase [Actinokineospora sp. NPDC004072]
MGRAELDGLEATWARRWAESGVYRFRGDGPRESVFSIDTPPPTVSGSLHVGHVFSYTHTDIIARFQRMRGMDVLYPMGWDDNGLPTERRVQLHYGVRCDPSLPYEPGLEPKRDKKKTRPVSRRNFVELCERLTEQDERAYEALWRRLGLSVDWTRTYTTIGARARALSQASFLRLLAAGQAYQAEAPTLWDTTFGTAVAQAELVDRDTPGAWHTLTFATAAGPAEVETTRPELLPACVALIAHPDDERHRALVGTTARSPLFGAEVPVLAHPAADPQRGSGLVMCCTFGDLTDVLWWRELGLPARAVVGRDGRLRPDPPPGVDPAAYAEVAGLGVRAAREKVVALLDLRPRPVTRPVKHYEKGDRPLEIVSSRQWFIRSTAYRDRLLERGRELRWQPESMCVRFENWVAGLSGDWLISRQRYFGVPFPLWYPLDETGTPDYANPLLPDELPCDPAGETPPGYRADQRDQPGGFTADPDVMDTWATSSLSPLLVCGYGTELFAKAYPMDLRPQAHEIIRTWLFSTVLRAELETGALPWRTAAISGWVLDPQRQKMGKSSGNGLGPDELLDRFGADAVRYWAASGRPGVDTAVDVGRMRVGRRLATKLLNASRFVLGFPEADDPVTEPLDIAALGALDRVVVDATAALADYRYTDALERVERFFWTWCDDYLELVKDRAYGDLPGAGSARAGLRAGLATLQRLFAPFLPFAAEEAWSWWRDGSVHTAAWPAPAGYPDTGALAAAGAVLAEVRGAKTRAKVSMRAPVDQLAVTGPEDFRAALAPVAADLRAAARAAEVVLRDGPDTLVAVALPPDGGPGHPTVG